MMKEQHVPQPVGRDELQWLIRDEDAQVLPLPEYEWAHLEEALHLPPGDLSSGLAGQRLDPDRPVIVYCNDHQ